MYSYNKHRKVEHRIILVVSFLAGFIFRLLNEILVGVYPIGYDPSVYYLYSVLCCDYDYILDAPLYPLFLLFLYRLLGGNIIVAIKLGSSLVIGFFFLSLAYWAINREHLYSWDVALFVLSFFTFWISLRIAWDLHRNLVSLSFSLIALSIYEKKPQVGVIMGFLSGVSHPFAIFFTIPPLLEDLKNKKSQGISLLISITAGTFIPVIGRYMIKGLSPIKDVSAKAWFIPRSLLLAYFVLIFLPIWVLWIIVFIINKTEFAKHLRESKKEAIWVFILFAESFIFKFGYRIQFLIFFPLLLITFRFINKKYSKKVTVTLIIYNLVCAFAISYFTYRYLPGSFRATMTLMLYGHFMSYNTAQKAIKLFKKAWSMMNNTTALIVHRRLVLYAYLGGIPICGKDNRVYLVRGGENISYILNIIIGAKCYEKVFLVWFTERETYGEILPDEFKIIDIEKPLALYEMEISSS